jgi:glycosyltransferase involved in cell wall biosynthesis
MRIVHVLTRGDILGGAQTHVLELSLQLRRLGHEVTVVLGAEGVFSDKLRQAGIPWLQIKSMVRPLRPHHDLVALVQLWIALRKLEPDLVCAHTAKAGSLGRTAAWLRSLPSVFTPHGWSMLDRATLRSHRLFRWAECLAGRMGTSIINVCEFERECARRFDICPDRQLEVVHNGIDELPMNRLRSVDAQPPTLVMVARFTVQKDHSTLLRALAGLLSLDWNLWLVGSGELREPLTAQAEALGLRGRVRLLPAKTDVNRLLMEAQIFVLSTHFEAFPISILEAMRAGLPVIATEVGGIPEVIRDHETGLMVRPGNVESLRAALARLINNPALRIALGEAGHRLWARRFTASIMATRTVEVYQRALAAHERRIPARSAELPHSRQKQNQA